jgi:hypothetical protein
LNNSPETPELVIDVGGAPRGAVPAGCRFIGTVERKGLDGGMLVQIESSGIFVQLIGSRVVWLDQQAVSDAMQQPQTQQEPESDLELEMGFQL